MDKQLNLPFCSKMTKAAEQGLVERRSFRFLVTGEEDDEHEQFNRPSMLLDYEYRFIYI